MFFTVRRKTTYEIDFYADRATLQGLRPSHLPSRAGTRASSHHFVRPSCFPGKGSPHSPNPTSHFSTHSRLQWDARSHEVQSGWVAFAKSLLLLYATMRTEILQTFLLPKLTSKLLLCRPRGVF